MGAQQQRFPDIGRERERRRNAELWGALHAFATDHGGAISSVRDTFPARLETPPNSSLPSMLPFAVAVLDGKRWRYTARRLTEDDTGGPVLRMTAPATTARAVDCFEIITRPIG